MPLKRISILIVLLTVGVVHAAIVRRASSNDLLPKNEQKALQALQRCERRFQESLAKQTHAAWAFGSNLTDYNQRKKIEAATEHAAVAKTVALELRQYDYQSFRNEDLKRRFKKLTMLEKAALPEDKFKELFEAVASMEANYAKIKLCSYKNRTNCRLTLDPEITEIMATSRDPEELKYYWTEWFDKAGKPTKPAFQKYLDLTKELATLNGFDNGADLWLKEYDDPTFEQQVENVMAQIKPLYEQIHAYVRFRLREKYGPDVVSEKGPIPIHLLGNMWGQVWENIADFTTPFPERKLLDVTEEMIKQGYTPLKMFHMGDDFFQSLNMTKLPQDFWDKSILEKPTDGRNLVCHASAWDFFATDDVRIKQCTQVKMREFLVVHHELGHIQYYLQYQHQPIEYRRGANPGFHEAVGDLLSLSVSTPKHLKKVGLLKDYEEDEQMKINQFYRSGVSKFIFLPFAYTMDKYRWSLFRGEVEPHEYNCRFWQLRSQFSGVEPPVRRTEEDFDPPAKYHVSADVEYLRYFVSFVIQFQFHKAACQLAGQYVPGDAEKTLNNCDIYQSVEAGNKIKEMLSLGSSKQWPDAMEILTGEREMSADAILEYFKPLNDWLVEENKRLGAHVGWTASDKCGRTNFDFMPSKK